MQPSRRGILQGGALIALGAGLGGAGFFFGESRNHGHPKKAISNKLAKVIQGGIITPSPPQSNVRIAVFRLREGRVIEEVMSGFTSARKQIIAEYGNDLTMTFGVSLDWARSLYPDSQFSESLPTFQREQLQGNEGGDFVVQFCADDPNTVFAAHESFVADFTESTTDLWHQDGFRPKQTERGEFRNAIGFFDGIINPRSEKKLDEGVWIDATDPASPLHGATYMVIRRLRFNMDRWNRMSTGLQERAVGRKKDTGAPLSGGERKDQVDLGAKHSNGEWVTPEASHARRAHPSFVGRPLMLRRGYGFHNSDKDQGTLFIAFMNDLLTFKLTQQRMDEMDDILSNTVCTGAGYFVVLPQAAFTA